MLDTLARLLPPLSGPTTLALCVLGLLGAATLWLAGSRFARPLATLFAVAVGGVVGLALPGWMNIGLAPAAAAVGAALLLGISGYLLWQAWLAMALGASLAMWGTLACWMLVAGSSEWSWPAWSEGATLAGYLSGSWQGMPSEFTTLAPFVAALLMLAGLVVGLVWRRQLVPLSCSVIGISLLTTLGLLVASIGQLHWRRAVPAATFAQAFMLLILSMFGALVQTRLKSVSGGKGD